jgi:DNA mismatch repair ATPase MutL
MKFFTKGFLFGLSITMFILALPNVAQANNPLNTMYKSKNLYKLLNHENRYVKYYVMGYITGVAFAYDDYGVICINKRSIEQSDLSKCVYQYMKNNPKSRKGLSSVVIKKSLQKRFPCEE